MYRSSLRNASASLAGARSSNRGAETGTLVLSLTGVAQDFSPATHANKGAAHVSSAVGDLDSHVIGGRGARASAPTARADDTARRVRDDGVAPGERCPEGREDDRPGLHARDRTARAAERQ